MAGGSVRWTIWARRSRLRQGRCCGWSSYAETAAPPAKSVCICTRARPRQREVIRVQIAASAITRAGIESLLRTSAEIEVVTGGADVLIAEDEAPADLAESGPPVILLSDDPQ